MSGRFPRETHQLSITVPVNHIESDDTATAWVTTC